MNVLSGHRPLTLMLILSACLFFLGINGLIGGFLMFKDPQGSPMGLPVGTLERTPFSDFVLPGLWLFFVWGIGSLVTLFGLWSQPHRVTHAPNKHWAWVLTLVIGVGLLIWLTVQLFTLPAIAPIQLVLFVLAALLIALPLLPAMRHYYSATI